MSSDTQPASAGELREALLMAQAQLREHNSEYQHRTDEAVLAKIDAALSESHPATPPAPSDTWREAIEAAGKECDRAQVDAEKHHGVAESVGAHIAGRYVRALSPRTAGQAKGDKSSDGGSMEQPFDPADAAGVKSGTVTPYGQTGRPNREKDGALQTPGSTTSIGPAKPITAGQASRPSEALAAPQPAGGEVDETPAARWRENGEPDPHGDRYAGERTALAHGDMTDDEIANAVFLNNHDIGILTAAKERIRWLSRALVKATAATAAPIAQPADVGVAALPVQVVAPATDRNGGSVRLESGTVILLSKADAASLSARPQPSALPGRIDEVLQRELADYEAKLTTAYADDALSVTGLSVIVYECEAAKRAVQSFAAALLASPVTPSEGADHLVWSNEHRCWWRANRAGYTNDVRQAGRYTKADAISISSNVRDGWRELNALPDELAIPINSLPENVRAALLPTPPKAGE